MRKAEEEREESRKMRRRRGTVSNYLEYLPLSLYCRASLGFMSGATWLLFVCVKYRKIH